MIDYPDASHVAELLFNPIYIKTHRSSVSSDHSFEHVEIVKNAATHADSVPKDQDIMPVPDLEDEDYDYVLQELGTAPAG